jgi:Fe-S-cluster containining protein
MTDVQPRPETVPEAPITLDETFSFRCNSSLDCFTCCCRDVSIVLTPYDVIRLKHALRIDSTEFLERYTISAATREQRIPVVILRMNVADGKCPFVTPQGCAVYNSRPWACRMYPLGLADPGGHAAAKRRFYFLIHEDLCHGHGCERVLSVREWVRDQGIEDYEMAGAGYEDFLLDDHWKDLKSLAPEHAEMCRMALFDLDRFRRFVFETRFLQRFDVDEARVEALRSDDLELLELSLQWLRFCYFHERTLRLSPSVQESWQEGTPQG